MGRKKSAREDSRKQKRRVQGKEEQGFGTLNLNQITYFKLVWYLKFPAKSCWLRLYMDKVVGGFGHSVHLATNMNLQARKLLITYNWVIQNNRNQIIV